MAETELYGPVKQFLESQGYSVKAEIGACDLVAVRGDEPPVAVELKTRLNLALVLQAVDRLAVLETVYVAFGVGGGRGDAWRTRTAQVISLLRRLGLGLLTVSAAGEVKAVLDPAPYRPRASRTRRDRLLKEFADRVGDPETGGSASRQRLTAYRQDAVRCARVLAEAGELPLRDLRRLAGVSRAGPLVRDNHYGWFERVRPGCYSLTAAGREALPRWSEALREQEMATAPKAP